MPKGVKEKDWPPPKLTYCDFCSRGFTPTVWNQRTCPQCKDIGAPDQAEPNYERLVDAWLKKNGRKLQRQETAPQRTTSKRRSGKRAGRRKS